MTVGIASVTIGTVSYTHLDVYKRQPSYGDADYRSPAQIRASQVRKHSPKRGPAPKKHDMKDVDKMLLTQSLENEFYAGNRRKR